MKKILFTLFIFASCFGLGLWFYNAQTQSAERALEEFYNYNGFYDKQTEPLWKAGSKVIPLVIEKVRDKKMPRRLKAIEFLGQKDNYKAISVLEEIINDSTEQNYTRKVALDSVFRIDKNEARRIAEQTKNEVSDLGNYSKCILTEDLCF